MISGVPSDRPDRGPGQPNPSGADLGGPLERITRLATSVSGQDCAFVSLGERGVVACYGIPPDWPEETLPALAAVFGARMEFVAADLRAAGAGSLSELLVGEHPPRSLAIIPMAPESNVGLFVLGKAPRTLQPHELESLRDLAALAKRECPDGLTGDESGLPLDAGIHKYHGLFDNTTDIIFVHDLAGTITEVNEAACQVSGYSREELVGLPLAEWADPSCAAQLRSMMLEQLGGGGDQPHELKLSKRDGGVIQVEVAGHLIFERGTPVGLMGFARDITAQQADRAARRTAEVALDAQGQALGQLSGYFEHLYRLDQAHHPDTAALAEDCLRTGCMVLDMDAGYVFEMKPEIEEPDLTHPLSAYAHRQGGVDLNLRQLRGVLAADRASFGRTIDAATGDLTIEVASCPVKVASRVWGMVCFVRAERPKRGFLGERFLSLLCARLGERLIHEELIVARRDPLTGLLNAGAFTLRLHRQLKIATTAKQPFALALMDLDSLRGYNQRYGFEAGDELIREVGQRFQELCGENEVAGRLGSDRFAAIVSYEEGAVEERLSRFLEAARKPVLKPDQRSSTTVSIGIALFPKHATGVQGLLRCADRAMVHVKSSGRNAVSVYSPSMGQKERAGARIDAGMHGALANDQFLVNYQPQINADGSLRGFEALVVWDHPEHGAIPAARFVPRAEETGLIIPIGEWVLGEVGRQMAVWCEGGLSPVTVAVNVSSIQFERPGFVDMVAAALAEHRLDPENLELEVTERTLVRDTAQSAQVMRRLQELGVRLAIDDFGTGYSSLSYLNRLPVHALKTDRSFVEEAETPETMLPTLHAIVELAHSLGLTVVGEGVERLTQLRLLERAGCDAIQGHLFGRPISAEAATQMIARLQAARKGRQTEHRTRTNRNQ